MSSSFFELPAWIRAKHAIVNIENKVQRCFVHSVLAHIHPVDAHPNRVSHYEPHLEELMTDGLLWPLPISMAPRFESTNPWDDKKDTVPLFVSKHHERQHYVNIDADGSQLRHYVLIRDMSALVRHRTKSSRRTYVCLRPLFHRVG